MIGRFRRFKPKSVRYRPMGPKDFKACRRLVARALASAERPEWAAGLGELDAARRGMKGVSLPRSQSAPASPFGQLLRLSERFVEMRIAERAAEALTLAQLAAHAAEILDAEETGASPARSPRVRQDIDG